MRILHVVERFYPRAGGVEFHVFHICRELAKLGHDVTVVTSKSVAQQDVPGISNKGLTIRSSLPDLPRYETDKDLVHVYRFTPRLALYTLYITPGLVSYLFQHIDEHDIVHVHQYLHAEPSIVAITSKLKKKPFVLTPHDMISPYRGVRSVIKNLGDVAFGRRVLRSAAALIAVAPTNRDECLQLGAREEQISIIPHGVPREEFESLKPSVRLLRDLGNPERVVLSVARLVEYKGGQYIIQAIPEILEDYPSTKFVFVGPDDGFGEELVRQAVNRGVYDNCLFTGQISDDRLKEFYATADVFVLTSTAETFGIVALESIAAGTPAVLADLGGLSYILTEVGGHPIDMTADVSKQIARAVKAVFKNDIHENIVAQRQKVLDDYSWASVAKQLVSVYEGVIGPGG
ncbi:MAG: glycosyltransferase family 4 protein [Halobacteriota archaeon]|jgi:glycosyltransferase involved in cell wall biosynthesis